MIYNADHIRNLNWPQAGLKDGRWVLARPLTFPTIPERFKAIWGVWTGKYDALEWAEQ